MSNELKIGRILEGKEKRDAIHVAIAPVEAAHRLRPGDHVGLGDDGKASDDLDPVGIVDPFLKREVLKGQKFWLFLYPNTVTSLRHDWVHPAFLSRDYPTQLSGAAPADWENICHYMREQDDYSDLPILADALEDYGWKNEEQVMSCRQPLNKIQSQRLVCLILGGELAEAVEWMDKFASRFTRGEAYPEVYDDDPVDSEAHVSVLDYEKLMAGIDEKDIFLDFDTPDFVYQEREKMWEMYKNITGKNDVDTTDIIFHCGC